MVDKSEKFSWLVRVGYFSRAIFYIMLGFLALTNANRIAEGTDGLFQAIEEYPAGEAMLWIMAVGLLAYALFRFCSPLFDIENTGSDAKGWAERIGHAGSGIGHLTLAWAAFQLASNDTSGHGGESGGGGAEQAASSVLSFEFGGIVLGLLGLAFFATSLFQFKKGLTGEFMNRISASAPDFTRWLGGAGYCARGVVYAVIGLSLVKAGFFSGGADQIKTLADAVAALASTGVLFKLTAVGLLLFGLFSLILTRYRIIPELGENGRVPAFRA
ncbi:DUF1206 domain-containing protein [Erythrobacter sp. 3-20A1M]|uniref:DUF1206 domain-containing protein n=1 Tax=Erythrobacter sp. 3-20A1M TaxID=2653850 RepID=UPI001BFCC06C|nr:DUF1206 domain-containing protein [Erythrobacter sp. 3-20A1M]QWC55675.1 DUF1206 domain-containing protein [Erythrobacter sp. 3-20A1M]